ncbi:MAG TPA: aminotransferase class V-fold PLP-dependent enzyme [Syntrophorhabdales bacterium]|nr:aminotransferase class V-fold PLP-dependent enzyme [Syntrophorhabdales bacterium]
MIYLDNAATSWPKPESVYSATDRFFRRKAGNPGRGSHRMATAARDIIQETRSLVARLINTSQAYRVVFTSNCTDSLNIGLRGLLKKGDHVIVDSIAHNSLLRPLRKLESQGVAVTMLKPSTETGCVSAADMERAIKKETRLIAITHASNVTGVIQPIEQYGEIARRHSLIYMVDAAQTAGVYPIDVGACNIDLVAFSGHKGLFGPPGTGVLYVGERADLDTLREGGTGSYSEMDVQPEVLPDKFESGTPNSIGIVGLGAGLKFIADTGIDTIRNHEENLTRQLISGLSRIEGVTLYAAPRGSRQAPVVSFNLFGYLANDVGQLLDRSHHIVVRAGLQCSPRIHRVLSTFPTGTVRISPGYFTTGEEIEAVIEAIQKIPAPEYSTKPPELHSEDC